MNEELLILTGNNNAMYVIADKAKTKYSFMKRLNIIIQHARNALCEPFVEAKYSGKRTKGRNANSMQIDLISQTKSIIKTRSESTHTIFRLDVQRAN